LNETTKLCKRTAAMVSREFLELHVAIIFVQPEGKLRNVPLAVRRRKLKKPASVYVTVRSFLPSLVSEPALRES